MTRDIDQPNHQRRWIPATQPAPEFPPPPPPPRPVEPLHENRSAMKRTYRSVSTVAETSGDELAAWTQRMVFDQMVLDERRLAMMVRSKPWWLPASLWRKLLARLVVVTEGWPPRA